MGEKTGIEWTDHTFNPWIGCTKVSPGCLNCYAERDFDHRRRIAHWGSCGTRVITSVANWRQPLKWDREARAAGVRRKVFCASLADVFEDFPGLDGQRGRLWELVTSCQQLDWLLLTKRPENIMRMVPPAWAPSALRSRAFLSGAANRVADTMSLTPRGVGAAVEPRKVLEHVGQRGGRSPCGGPRRHGPRGPISAVAANWRRWLLPACRRNPQPAMRRR